MISDLKEVIMVAIISIAAVGVASYISKCENTKIEVTCDTSKKECLDWLYRAGGVR